MPILFIFECSKIWSRTWDPNAWKTQGVRLHLVAFCTGLFRIIADWWSTTPWNASFRRRRKCGGLLRLLSHHCLIGLQSHSPKSKPATSWSCSNDRKCRNWSLILPQVWTFALPPMRRWKGLIRWPSSREVIGSFWKILLSCTFKIRDLRFVTYTMLSLTVTNRQLWKKSPSLGFLLLRMYRRYKPSMIRTTTPGSWKHPLLCPRILSRSASSHSSNTCWIHIALISRNIGLNSRLMTWRKNIDSCVRYTITSCMSRRHSISMTKTHFLTMHGTLLRGDSVVYASFVVDWRRRFPI